MNDERSPWSKVHEYLHTERKAADAIELSLVGIDQEYRVFGHGSYVGPVANTSPAVNDAPA